MGGVADVGADAGPPVSISLAAFTVLEAGKAATGAASVLMETVASTISADSASGVVMAWAAIDNPVGGRGGTRSPSLTWVAAETRCRSTSRQSALPYFRRGKKVKLFRPSGKVMFSAKDVNDLFFLS